MDVLQNARVALGIAEGDVSQLNAALDLSSVCNRLHVSRLDRRQRDIGEPLQVQAQNAEVDRLLDELDGLFREILLVAHEREDHADRESIAERKSCGQINRDDVLQAENNVVDRAKSDLGPAEPNIRAYDIAVAVQPLPLALVLAVENFQGLYRAHVLDKGAVLLSLCLEGRLRSSPDHTIGGEPKGCIEKKGGKHRKSEKRAVDENHHKRDRGHDPVKESRYQAFGKEVANRL